MIAGLFSLIPLVGATIAAVLIGIVTVFEDFPTITIIWAIWAIVYQQFENHVIQPQIQKRTVKVQPFITIVAVLFGATLLGVMGALVAIPVAASIQILVREYVDLRTLSIKKDEDRGDEPPQSLHRWRRPLPTRLPRSLFNMKPAALASEGSSWRSQACRSTCWRRALLEVFGAWDRLDDISPLWFVGMIVLQAGSYASMCGSRRSRFGPSTSDRWSRPSWRPTPSAGWFRAGGGRRSHAVRDAGSRRRAAAAAASG